MTSEVCIMNRQAAVLAADSATTVSRWAEGKLETRYFKGANKIVQLSHHHPVGVMIFNSAELLQVPWELLIKGFRDHLQEKAFNELEGYAQEFFTWLDGNARYFPEPVQQEAFNSAAQSAVLGLALDIDQKQDEDAKRAAFDQAIEARRDKLETMPAPPRLDAEKLPTLIAALRGPLSESLQGLLSNVGFVLPGDPAALAEVAITDAFKTPSDKFGTAGLVFAGYRDHAIFPAMIEYRSSGMVSGTAIMEEVSRSTIDHDRPAALNAFAQTSMADTFHMGFSEDVYNALMSALVSKLGDFAGKLAEALGADLQTLANFGEIVEEARKGISEEWFNRAREEHAYPLRRVLGALPVDEMAELAETLVNLQSLKEKVTKPSESVGGPVDVAIITRHEGLVWVKRKKFFETEMNPRYLLRQGAVYR
jgi:hypothetical protein